MSWNTFYYILSIIYGLIVSVDGQERALWNLEEMSICALGYPAIAYNNYGCWCGVGGSGKPMDGIDRCCMNHDFCYDEAVRKHECYDTAEEYVYPYRWACNNSHPVCLNNANTACSSALCSCDRDVVECWSRFGKPKVRAHCIKMNTTKHHVRRPARHTSVFGKILNALEAAVLHPT